MTEAGSSSNLASLSVVGGNPPCWGREPSVDAYVPIAEPGVRGLAPTNYLLEMRMRLPWKRQRHAAQAGRRPNYTRIAVLEHDLCGVQPEPGTMAALTIMLRSAGTCLRHTPIDTSTVDDPRPVGICQRCGRPMLLDENGAWVVSDARA